MHGWADIVGQDDAVEALMRAKALSRVAHAYLFFGPRGVGKCTVALRFAALLLCDEPRDQEACGGCPSCRAFRAGEHPDFDRIAPLEGARWIPIDAIREMSRRAHLTPSRASRRVFVVDGAHALTEEAANSLLKTLEEPPPGTVIILVTFKPEALLPTVLSRTHPMAFKALPSRDCTRVLTEDHGVPPADAETLTALAGGAPGRALELKRVAAYNRRGEIFGEILEADRERVFEGAEVLMELARESSLGSSLEARRDGVRIVFQMADTFLRDMEVTDRAGTGEEILNKDHRERVAEGLSRGGGGWADFGLSALSRAREALDRNVNPSLVVEWWLSQLVQAKELARDGRSPEDQ